MGTNKAEELASTRLDRVRHAEARAEPAAQLYRDIRINRLHLLGEGVEERLADARRLAHDRRLLDRLGHE